MYPTREKLEETFRLKHGDIERCGWRPRLYHSHGYFTPHDVYEAAVNQSVSEQTEWLDVGGGGSVLVYNPRMAQKLAERCRLLVGLDPSSNIQGQLLRA